MHLRVVSFTIGNLGAGGKSFHVNTQASGWAFFRILEILEILLATHTPT